MKNYVQNLFFIFLQTHYNKMVKAKLGYVLVLIKGLLSFLIFTVTSQFFSLLIFIPFTNKKKAASTFYTSLLNLYARFILKTHFNIQIKYINKNKETFDNPVLVVCNHQSIIDVPISMSFTSKIRVLNNNWHDNKVARFFITKYIGFFSIFEEKNKLVSDLEPSVSLGCPVLVFPEGIMSNNQKIHRFHKGGFYLAQKLRMNVQPVVIFYSKDILKKSWFYLKHGKAIVKFLEPVEIDSGIYGQTYQELTHYIMNEMRREYADLKKTVESGGY